MAKLQEEIITVSKISPGLGETPGDRRGLQGNQNVSVTEDFKGNKNRNRAPSIG
jgi:hypothetical protein